MVSIWWPRFHLLLCRNQCAVSGKVLWLGHLIAGTGCVSSLCITAGRALVWWFGMPIMRRGRREDGWLMMGSGNVLVTTTQHQQSGKYIKALICRIYEKLYSCMFYIWNACLYILHIFSHMNLNNRWSTYELQINYTWKTYGLHILHMINIENYSCQ